MKNKAFIKSAFTAAAKGTAWGVSAYFWPSSWKKAIAGCMMTFFIAVPTARFFPEADDVLRDEGIDPAILRTLTDREVHVGSQDINGILYHTMRLPFLPLQVLINVPYQAQSFPAHKLDAYSYLVDGKKYFFVSVPNIKNIGDRKAVSLHSGIPEKYIENTGASAENFYQYTQLHEIRHSATANEQAQKNDLAEADSDEQALKALVGKLGANPALIKAVINFRITNEILRIRKNDIDDTHNTSLYLDAQFRGKTAPSMDEAQKASNEAYEKMKAHLADSDDREDFIRYTEAFRAILAEDETLSPLARRAAELFVEAVEYHAPAAVGGQTRPQTVYNVPADPAIIPVPKTAEMALF